MNNKLNYNGYTASIIPDVDRGLFFGRVENVLDVISFQGKDLAELKANFKEAIDEYISFCKEVGEEPEKPFGGSILFRCGPERHRKIAQEAARQGVSINTFLVQAADKVLSKDIAQVNVNLDASSSTKDINVSPEPAHGKKTAPQFVSNSESIFQ